MAGRGGKKDVERADGLYDVDKVVRESVRPGLDLDNARRVARANLATGGRVLSSHHSAPDEFELF